MNRRQTNIAIHKATLKKVHLLFWTYTPWDTPKNESTLEFLSKKSLNSFVNLRWMKWNRSNLLFSLKVWLIHRQIARTNWPKYHLDSQDSLFWNHAPRRPGSRTYGNILYFYCVVSFFTFFFFFSFYWWEANISYRHWPICYLDLEGPWYPFWIVLGQVKSRMLRTSTVFFFPSLFW